MRGRPDKTAWRFSGVASASPSFLGCCAEASSSGRAKLSRAGRQIRTLVIMSHAYCRRPGLSAVRPEKLGRDRLIRGPWGDPGLSESGRSMQQTGLCRPRPPRSELRTTTRDEDAPPPEDLDIEEMARESDGARGDPSPVAPNPPHPPGLPPPTTVGSLSRLRRRGLLLREPCQARGKPYVLETVVSRLLVAHVNSSSPCARGGRIPHETCHCNQLRREKANRKWIRMPSQEDPAPGDPPPHRRHQPGCPCNAPDRILPESCSCIVRFDGGSSTNLDETPAYQPKKSTILSPSGMYFFASSVFTSCN